MADLFALAEANIVPYELALNISLYLVKENEFLPSATIIIGLKKILSYFGDEPETQTIRVGHLPIFELIIFRNCHKSKSFIKKIACAQIIHAPLFLSSSDFLTKIEY